MPYYLGSDKFSPVNFSRGRDLGGGGRGVVDNFIYTPQPTIVRGPTQ